MLHENITSAMAAIKVLRVRYTYTGRHWPSRYPSIMRTSLIYPTGYITPDKNFAGKFLRITKYSVSRI